MIVYKGTLYKLYIDILRHDFDQSGNVFQMKCNVTSGKQSIKTLKQLNESHDLIGQYK